MASWVRQALVVFQPVSPQVAGCAGSMHRPAWPLAPCSPGGVPEPRPACPRCPKSTPALCSPLPLPCPSLHPRLGHDPGHAGCHALPGHHGLCHINLHLQEHAAHQQVVRRWADSTAGGRRQPGGGAGPQRMYSAAGDPLHTGWCACSLWHTPVSSHTPSRRPRPEQTPTPSHSRRWATSAPCTPSTASSARWMPTHSRWRSPYG